MSTNLLLATFLVFLAGTAHAQTANEARKYAVLSLIGDALSVISYQPRTGSSIDTNRHELIPITDGSFDKTALMATDAALRKIDAQASVVLLTSSSQSLYQEQEKLFSGSQLVLPDEIATVLKSSGATHLIILTKYRGEARLQAAQFNLGSGKLTGLGFYVDRQYRLSRSDTGERSVGFLAPFVYFKISLVDVATLAVLREEIATATTTLSAARSKDADPWNVLTPGQKVERINSMTRGEVSRAVPVLVSNTKEPS